MILNPWFWVGLLVWSALAAGTGYWKGSKAAQDAAGKRHAEELAATVKDWQERALIDAQAAFDAAESRQKTKLEYRDRVVTVEKVLNAKPQNPDCALPDDAVRLLNSAIGAANHTPPTTVHAALPAVTAAP